MLKRIARWTAVAALLIVALVTLTLGACRWQAAARETKTRQEDAPASGRFVRAADIDIFIQETGPENAPVVLFVHGMGAWSELWRTALGATAAAGFRAVALDLPPFGYSERPVSKKYGRIDQARRILGVIDALGARQVTLVGHSFGGGPTLEAVLMAPERVNRLVLADAAVGLGEPTANPGLAGSVLGVRPLRNALVSATVTNPRLTRRLLTQFVARPEAVHDSHIAILQAPMDVQGGTAAFGDWLLDFVTNQETVLSRQPSSYAKLAIPTLVIWGDQDTTTPLAQGQELARVIPGAKLAVMPGVGHMPQIEDSRQFLELLLSFLIPRDAGLRTRDTAIQN
jgi:pimeloyl-ACP methyl ester carboxylesterase